MYIYKITNIINNKIYIGKTSRNIEVRMKEHFKLSHDSKLSRAIKKYGKESFLCEIIFQANDIDSLNWAEIELIKYNKSIKLGYNTRSGGEGGSFSPEVIDKISKTHTGRKHPYSYKSVIRISKDLKEIKKYPSMISTKEDGFCPIMVRYACTKRVVHHKNYYWCFESEYTNFTARKRNCKRTNLIRYNFKTGIINTFDSLYPIQGLCHKAIKKCLTEKRLCYQDSFWFYENDFSINNLKNKYKSLSNPYLVFNLDPSIKGFYQHNITKTYAAKIKINGKKKSLGYYSTKEEASAVYNLALYNKLREYIG